jgi:hypothetical protein
VRQVELRNSVLVITAGGEVLAELDGVLDRSQLMPPTAMKPAVLDDKGDRDYSHGLEH